MKQHQSRPTVWVGTALVWAVLVVGGLCWLNRFSETPGAATKTPPRWPAGSVIPAPQGRPLMVLALHPKCSCSRATVAELNRLMVSTRGRVDVHALMMVPAGEKDFVQGGLRETLESLPDVHIHEDVEAREAGRFGAKTSGAVLLYSSAGQLIYSGGITPARGHEGDSIGRTSVLNGILFGSQSPTTMPVFGCALD